MWGYVAIDHVNYIKCNFLFEGKERPEKTKLFLAKLRAVLAYTESDSCSVSYFWIFRKCNVSSVQC